MCRPNYLLTTCT